MPRLPLLALSLLVACNADKSSPDPTDTGPLSTEWACLIAEGSDPDYAQQLGCEADFDALASEPADASIPGATSVKTIVDRANENTLYFQNSKRYCIHWDFASTHLSGGRSPVVPPLAQFNATEYFSPDRRFILGALSYYEGPMKWVFELSPYDAADAAMIVTAFNAVRDGTWLKGELSFHPTSSRIEGIVGQLPKSIPITTTDQLYGGIDYQPLNPGTSTGILRFHSAAEVDGKYTPFREIVVLDAVPNDISIVSGVITAETHAACAEMFAKFWNIPSPSV